MLKTEFLSTKDWFSNVNVYVDLGYQGIKKDYCSDDNIQIPYNRGS